MFGSTAQPSQFGTNQNTAVPLNIDSVTDRVRILVVGDQGVGKTSLVQLLCTDAPIAKPPAPTVGFEAEVMIHTHTRTKKPYWIEFVDVSGARRSNAEQSSGARNALYGNAVNGVILAHDLTSKLSYRNLWDWIAEVFWHGGDFSKNEHKKKQDYELDLRVGTKNASAPVLLVGMKADIVTSPGFGSSISPTISASRQNSTAASRGRRYSVVEEYGGHWINLSTQDPYALASDAAEEQVFVRFFDRVIDRKFYPIHTTTYGSSNNVEKPSQDMPQLYPTADYQRRRAKNADSLELTDSARYPSTGLGNWRSTSISSLSGHAAPLQQPGEYRRSSGGNQSASGSAYGLSSPTYANNRSGEYRKSSSSIGQRTQSASVIPVPEDASLLSTSVRSKLSLNGSTSQLHRGDR